MQVETEAQELISVPLSWKTMDDLKAFVERPTAHSKQTKLFLTALALMKLATLNYERIYANSSSGSLKQSAGALAVSLLAPSIVLDAAHVHHDNINSSLNYEELFFEAGQCMKRAIEILDVIAHSKSGSLATRKARALFVFLTGFEFRQVDVDKFEVELHRNQSRPETL